MAQVPGYDYNPDRDRRWRSIVDNFCVLQTTNEADEVVPRWGEPSTFDGENAEAIVRTVFADVAVEPWDVVAYRLPDRDAITEYLAVFYKLAPDEARRRAASLPAPLPITKRGLYVWAKKGDGPLNPDP